MTLSKPSDRERILWLLAEQGGISSQQVKSELALSDDRYNKVITQLIEEGLVEKFRRRAGGIRVTYKGMAYKKLPDAISSFSEEREIYSPFCKILEGEIKDNEENAIVINTSDLKKRGKWSNPDITKIAIRHYPMQGAKKIIIFTYEIKQWKRWNIEAVYEAASHLRFAHNAFVVLEWAKDVPYEGMEYLESASARFGVGLITLHPYYNSFRYSVRISPEYHVPSEDTIEEYFETVFAKHQDKYTSFITIRDQNNGQ